MKTRYAVALALAAIVWTRPDRSAADPQAAAEKIRVLIVTGEDVPAHDWKATTRVTRQALEAAGRFDVRVSEDIGILESDALEHYDVLVLNFRNNPKKRDINERGRKNLLDFVASGKGIVPLHFNVRAFDGWLEFRELVGRYWKPKHSGHGPRGPLRVEVADGDHPITKGLEPFEIDDELYSRLVEVQPIHVLVKARSDWSQAVEPLAWTLEYGKGRVFNTVLGHDASARSNPAFIRLLVRGVEWAARGEVAGG